MEGQRKNSLTKLYLSALGKLVISTFDKKECPLLPTFSVFIPDSLHPLRFSAFIPDFLCSYNVGLSHAIKFILHINISEKTTDIGPLIRQVYKDKAK